MSVEDRIEWQNRFIMNAEFEWVLKEEEQVDAAKKALTDAGYEVPTW